MNAETVQTPGGAADASGQLPRVAVALDGQPLSREVAARLGVVTVNHVLSLPSQCELSFFNIDQSGEPGAFQPGTGVTLQVALEGAETVLFTGEVTAVETTYTATGEQQVRIRGYDALYKLRKRQSVRSHVELTTADLARELVGDLGLTVTATDTGPLWHRIVQWRQSDLELLNETAARSGLYFTLQYLDLEDAGTLQITSLAGFGDAIPLHLGSSLHDARVEANTDPACAEVSLLAWDPWLSVVHQGRVSAARSGREVAQQANSELQRQLVGEVAQTDQQAELFAQGDLDRRSAAAVVIHGTAAGNQALQPGKPIDVAGLGEQMSGRYVLTEVCHRVNRQEGFTTAFTSQPPAPLHRSKSSLATLGVVTAVNDPEGLGRVCVALSCFADLESDWFEVLCAGAGADKGIIALPDVGDQVLVLLLEENPAQGIVLGGLYGTTTPPDTGVEGNAIKRYTFVTPRGQQIQLDDANNSVTLKNRGGNNLQLTPGRVRVADNRGSFLELTRDRTLLHSAADMEIEASGKTITIRGASIEFEQG